MRNTRLILLPALVLVAASCGRSSSHDDSPPNPPGPPPPVNITGPGLTLAPGFPGVAISPITFTATGTPPITWTVTGGTLTAGLNLSLSGVLSGTPTTVGLFSFTVTATDANGTDSANFSQTVATSILETEPNDTPATADALSLQGPARGTLSADDIDFWSFSATTGMVIQVELFALRRDFASWDTNFNLPRLNLIGPNGTSYLDGPDYVSSGWLWGAHDLDIPLFRIPAGGTYFVRLENYVAATPGGDYALRVTEIPIAGLQEESESNDSSGTADAITPGTIHANHVDGNEDYFSFAIAAPTLVYFEVTGYRNGIFGVLGAPDADYYDPRIELLDTDGSTVMATNNNAFFNDSAINFHLATPGTYYLRVGQAASGLVGNADYFITFNATPVGSIVEVETNDDTVGATPIAYGDVVSGTMSGDEDWFSFSGNAGDMVRVFWFEFGASQVANDFVDIYFMLDDTTFIQRAISYTGVNSLACARAILPSTGTFYVRVVISGGSTPYTFQLVRVKAPTAEVEGNDAIGTANAIPVSGLVAGTIGSNTDVDFYSFTAAAGEVVTFSIYAGVGAQSNGFYTEAGYNSTLFPDLEVRNAVGTVLGATPYDGVNFCGESVTNGLATSELTFVAATAGTYYIRVSPSDASGDADHLYVLEKR
jgi:hypothetical protein